MSRARAVEESELTEIGGLGEAIAEEPAEEVIAPDEAGEPGTVGEGMAEQDVPAQPKIGVNRFLQLHRQDKMTADLMRSLFRMDLHTESEWFHVRDEMLGHKVTR